MSSKELNNELILVWGTEFCYNFCKCGVTGEKFRILRNDEFHDLYRSPSTARIVESTRLP